MPILWDSRRGKIGKKVDVTSIEINGSSSVNEGATITLNAVVKPNNTTQSKDVKWTSSNEDVATVANGVVTAKSTGKTTITVCSVANPSICASKDVTVNAVEHKYTYESKPVYNSFGQLENFSIVIIYKDGVDVSKAAQRAYHDKTNLGSYNENYGGIIVNNAEKGNVNRVYHENAWHSVSPK